MRVPVYGSASLYIGIVLIAYYWSDAIRTEEDSSTSLATRAIAFALLLFTSIFLHELGHLVAVRMSGMKPREIHLHAFGGSTHFDRSGLTPGRNAFISAAGPAVNFLLGISLAAISWSFGENLDRQWSYFVEGLAWANLVLAVYNILPGLPLDGGGVTQALIWKITKSETRGITFAVYAGRGVAGLVLLVPYVAEIYWGIKSTTVDFIFAAMFASSLIIGGNEILRTQSSEIRLKEIDLNELSVRCIAVQRTLKIRDAINLARQQNAGAIIVVDENGLPFAIVVEEAAHAIPPERRVDMDIVQVSRRLDPESTLTLGMSGDEIAQIVDSTNDENYLVVDNEGLIVGVAKRNNLIDYVLSGATNDSK